MRKRISVTNSPTKYTTMVQGQDKVIGTSHQQGGHVQRNKTKNNKWDPNFHDGGMEREKKGCEQGGQKESRYHSHFKTEFKDCSPEETEW